MQHHRKQEMKNFYKFFIVIMADNTQILDRYADQITQIDKKICLLEKRKQQHAQLCAKAGQLENRLADYLDTVKIVRYCRFFEMVLKQHRAEDNRSDQNSAAGKSETKSLGE